MRERLVLQPVRLVGVAAEALVAILLVVAEVALEPRHLAVALEREHVGGDAVEEPAVVGDDHRAARELEQRLFERAQRVDVEVVGRLVEQQHVAAHQQRLGEMQPVALATREIADALLLVGALEVEAGDVRAAVHLAVADLHEVDAAGDLLVDGLVGVERLPRLVDVRELHRGADLQRTAVGLLLADEHAEQRGLARAVGADDADDAAGRQREVEVFDEEPIAVALGDLVGLDDEVAETRARRDRDLHLLLALLRRLGFGDELVVRRDARLALGLAGAGREPHPLELALQRAAAGLVDLSSCASRCSFCSSQLV